MLVALLELFVQIVFWLRLPLLSALLCMLVLFSYGVVLRAATYNHVHAEGALAFHLCCFFEPYVLKHASVLKVYGVA
jgi:hypothetical protein